MKRSLLIAIAPLLLSGCGTFGSLPEPTGNEPTALPAGNASEATERCPSVGCCESIHPHTLPEALHAYCHCLLFGPPPEEKKANDAQDKASDKEKGKDQEKDKEKEKEKDKDKTQDKEAGADKENGNDSAKEPEEKWYSAHAQFTAVTQAHSNFNPPYTGPRSLLPSEPMATSVTGTLFLNTRLWEGGELIFNPEIAGGSGFSGVDGLAGFSNGEITRVGLVEPTWYFARFYLRQTFGLGGEQEEVKDEINEIAGKRDINRFTINVGKFTCTDFVDDNTYAHDPRTQFLNWSLMYNGAWDYPANVRGYTYGVDLEYNTKWWSLNYGIVAEPSIANGAPLDPHIAKAHGQFLELEERYECWDHPGKIRFMAYLNNAHMGNYRQAVALMPVDPDITLTETYSIKYGFCMSWDQEFSKDFGMFGRLGWDNGQTETWAFTPIDATASLGAVLKGCCWCRPNDAVGLGGAINGLSDAHRAYLAAGGLDFSIGDGKLNYGPEEILEVYYLFEIIKGIQFTVDFQEINNMAYNRDRGAVSVGSMRLHLEY
jgi:high affinity Mn2+ porin